MDSPKVEASEALRKVIDGGYCIGCGVCAAMDDRIHMGFNPMGQIQASLPSDVDVTEALADVCPFSDFAVDEDVIASELFDHQQINSDDRIGRYIGTFAGWVEEGDLRSRASSGGIGTWLQCELLADGLVDAVVSVMPRETSGAKTLFKFSVARTSQAVLDRAKTRYYPVEMSAVIRFVLETPGKYAFIGTPCFAKALRLAQKTEPLLAERIKFVLGIVCGHLKSSAFSEALAWQCGLAPDGIQDIDFRSKLEGRPASRYGVAVTGKRIESDETLTVTRPMEGLLGANWGHGLFKYKACEYCDDVLAETADAVVGDAWLPSYDSDHRGANIVIVRNPEVLDLLKRGRDDARLHLDEITADQVAESQAGGLRHRRQGLSYRLWLDDQAGVWRPKKRVEASRRHLVPSMRRIHKLRLKMGQFSHQAFAEAKSLGNLSHFHQLMNPIVSQYEKEIRPSWLRRAMNLIERVIDQGIAKISSKR